MGHLSPTATFVTVRRSAIDDGGAFVSLARRAEGLLPRFDQRPKYDLTVVMAGDDR